MSTRPLSTGEVARLIGCSIHLVINAIDRGAIPAFRLPGSKARRVYLDDLEKYADAHGIRLLRHGDGLGILPGLRL